MNQKNKTAFRESPWFKAWSRLKKNKPAVLSLCIIIIAVFLAIFAPLIAPDKTPDANEQILELANKNPGYQATLLLIRKNREEASTNIFSRLSKGRENPYRLIPITSYVIDGSTLVASLYKGDYLPAVEQSYELVDIAFPLMPDTKKNTFEGSLIRYTLYNGHEASVPLTALQKNVATNHIQTRTFWLGTDNYGRDILSRLLFGVRVSVSVGFVAVLIAMTIGITLGAVAGYFRGFLDNSIMWLINVIWAVPTILLAMALTFALDTRLDRFWVIYLAVGLSMWVEVARIVRGQVMSVREMEYVQAARGLGFGHARIIFRHILPNIIGPIMVIAAADFASAILIEAGLSLVGIGVRPPMPSWGVMLNEHHNYLFIPEKAFLALAPGIAIMILVLAFNLLGNGLRDAFDVKGKLR
jgi:peptide/nickel transport system permease protein